MHEQMRQPTGAANQHLLRAILIVSVVLGCWLGMQAVHELGHVLAAWMSGGQVHRVSLHPLTISQTVLTHNPHPTVVVWGGPLIGVLLPLTTWAIAAAARWPAAFVLRFFAGFCLVANGAYIGGGSFVPLADAADMLVSGTPVWVLWLFALVSISAGLWLWHGQGSHFGVSRSARPIDPRVAYASLLVCAVGYAAAAIFG